MFPEQRQDRLVLDLFVVHQRMKLGGEIWLQSGDRCSDDANVSPDTVGFLPLPLGFHRLG
jgi:hypothetical protein